MSIAVIAIAIFVNLHDFGISSVKLIFDIIQQTLFTLPAVRLAREADGGETKKRLPEVIKHDHVQICTTSLPVLFRGCLKKIRLPKKRRLTSPVYLWHLPPP
jgi:hypothetical protein